MSASTTDEARFWVRDGISIFAPVMGRKAALHHLAVGARTTTRRLEAIGYGEVKKLWADEYLALRAAYRKWCRDGRDRLAARVEQMDLALERLEGE